nr:sigma-70 family RNA polymerase sigma factor [Kofleriaceae bacterium]
MEPRARDELVEAHLDVARKAASMIFPRVSQYVDYEELVALGNAGLVEAAQRFDPARGVPFGAFAWYRVQGAIVDGLRRATNLPRRQWAQLVALRAAGEYLENRSERDAGAATRGAPELSRVEALSRVQDALAAIRVMFTVSLDAASEVPLDQRAPAEALDLQRASGRLSRALAALPDKQRELMTKHYWEGKNLLEAGVEMGISKSWASRLHSQAVDKLRALLAAADDG